MCSAYVRIVVDDGVGHVDGGDTALDPKLCFGPLADMHRVFEGWVNFS
jgi:hypothetical protein